MRAQLAALVPPGFLRDVPASALADYPRYLRALVLRSERAPCATPASDQARMLELKPFADAVACGRQRSAARSRLAGACAGTWRNCGCRCSRRNSARAPGSRRSGSRSGWRDRCAASKRLNGTPAPFAFALL
jgi:hypothetical protein